MKHLHKMQLAFYTSNADEDSLLLKHYTDEDKQSQAARAWAEFTILKAWWEGQGFNNKTVYDVWCSVVEPRGYLLGGACHTSQDLQRLVALINDYKETFLPDYDDDNVWWGKGEEPIEGYAMEYVWIKLDQYQTIIDSRVTRLGCHRKYAALRIETEVSNNFYVKGGEDGLPF
jgi:hypothetical protein